MTILASLLALALLAVAGFSTTAGAALKRPYAPKGATGTGVNAPPVGSDPLIPGVAWDAKNYRITYHAKVCPQPPQSTAARLALANSPLLLTYYGLPTPDEFKGNFSKWQYLVTMARTRSCDHSDPVLDGKPIVNDNYYNSTSWGGYGSNCSCDQYMAADAQFTVQNITYSSYTADSVWVGVGGSASMNNALVQAGVAQKSVAFTNYFNAFYEAVAATGYDRNEHDLFPVNTGDNMYFYVNDAGHDHLWDYTQGKYQTVDWGYSSTESAEFIIERNCGTACPLAHFNPYTWTYAEFEDFNTNWGRVNFFGITHWQLDSTFQYPYFPLTSDSGLTNDSYGSQWTTTWKLGS